MRDFNTWLGQMRSSINGYNYYVDFPKVYSNVDSIKIELNIMNSLIGSKNIESDFVSLLKKYPEILKCVPTLLAVRQNEIYAHDIDGSFSYDFCKINHSIDPTSGSGSLLINIGNCVAKHIEDANNIKYFAQELKQNTYNLTRMNLIMRGILPSNILTRNGDTLEDDWPYFDENDPIGSYNPLYVDAVVSNPPYSQNWDPENKESDPRYARFGLAPKGKADYAFLLHDLYHIKPDGIMTIVLPHGVLFRGGEEGTIRKNLIENNHIDAIIGLPANIFFGTGIPTIIMVLKQKRENTDVLIVDASKNFMKVGKNNLLQASDIKRITDAVIQRKNAQKFSKVVTRDEIRSNDYNLNIPRYVDSSGAPESWDIYASMFGGIPKKEINKLDNFWKAFPGLKESLFIEISEEHMDVVNENLRDVIKGHQTILEFKVQFDKAFENFDKSLYDQLIKKMDELKISSGETLIGNEIFERLKSISLIDEYIAYQLLHDEWVKISVDLEMIQTEGHKALKQVDPYMVSKKKNGKDIEVQEGWVGRILPFDLVQEIFLLNKKEDLNQKESRLQTILSEKQDIMDSLSEDEKEELSDALNEDNTAFLSGPLTKAANEILKNNTVTNFSEDSPEFKLLKMKSLLDEEKELKGIIKLDSEKLHLLTKKTIESLNDDQVEILLNKKWITPILDGLNQLPNEVLGYLESKVQTLADKYITTLANVEEEIKKTEAILSTMLDDLTGSESDMKGLAELKLLLGGK